MLFRWVWTPPPLFTPHIVLPSSRHNNRLAEPRAIGRAPQVEGAGVVGGAGGAAGPSRLWAKLAVVSAEAGLEESVVCVRLHLYCGEGKELHHGLLVPQTLGSSVRRASPSSRLAVQGSRGLGLGG